MFEIIHDTLFIWLALAIIGLIFLGSLLGFIKIIFFLKNDYKRTISAAIVTSLQDNLKTWDETHKRFEHVYWDIHKVIDRFDDNERAIGESIFHNVNALLKQIQIFGREHQEELESLTSEIDDLVMRMDSIIESNKVILKQQAEIQKWQRRAQRIEHDN